MGKPSRGQRDELFGARLPIERELLASGMSLICGVDEAGRGPLAGPVVAAAVLFRDCELLWSAQDSKKMTVSAREEFFARVPHELEFGVGACTPEEIDEINILQASLRAMERAVALLPCPPQMILVDGNRRLNPSLPSRAIVHGDACVAVISAASIIAKVTRDRLMRDYDAVHPEYGFARHFGYPTEEHRRLLKQLGPCPIHRRTFQGVREFFQENLETK
ncbi:MAG TPA: ribonuclease HII [bacterium]|jgi:ribonuclease HII